MKQILIVVYCTLVVTNAQFPGFSISPSGFGGFSLSSPIFNSSFTPANPLESLSRIPSRIGNVVNNVQQSLPRLPQLPNPITAFSRFARPSGNSENINSNINTVRNTINNRVGAGVNAARNAFDEFMNRIPGVPNFANPGDLFNSFKDSMDKITNQRVTNPGQIFNQMNQFLPEVARVMNNIANFTNSAANTDAWRNITDAVRRQMQDRIESMVSGFSNITSAMKNVAKSLPSLLSGQQLNTTLRNEPFFFPNRSGIVHLFEWKFDDIAEECEKVLGPNRYGGVQVSPINEYLVSSSRTWSERYQPVSYEIKSRSGSEKQFSNMVQRCLKAGVRVYVDVVINHMAAPGTSTPLYGTAGSTCDPLTRDFPAVPFNSSHFHADCLVDDYTNATNVRSCELASLPDLDQSNSFVREQIVKYLNRLIDLGVAGFRVDASEYMAPSDLKVIYDSLKPVNPLYFYPPLARPFIYQEVIDLGNGAVSANEYTDLGVVTEFQWGIVVGDIFGGTLSASALEIFTKNGSTGVLLPSRQAMVFVDNHKTQRGLGAGGASVLNYKKKPQYIQAVAFTLATDYGIPRVMSSYAFANSDQGPPQDSLQIIESPGFVADGSCTSDWVCEHRWPEIKRMILFKNYVDGTSLDHVQSTNETFAFCRGQKGFIVFNNSENIITKVYHTCLPQGQYCDIISGELSQGACTGTVINVDANGDAEITLAKNSVVALYIPSKV